MKLDVAIERFRTHLAHERDLSDRTVEAYCTDLAQLSCFLCERKGREPAVARIDLHDIRAFLSGEVTRGLSGRSMMRKVSSIRAFFRFLVRRGVIVEDPTVHLAQQIQRRGIPTIISEDRIRRMMDLPDTGTLKGKRDRATRKAECSPNSWTLTPARREISSVASSSITSITSSAVIRPTSFI